MGAIRIEKSFVPPISPLVNIEDEGVLVVATQDVNFVGAGVTVTENPAGTAEVSIPGGASFWTEAESAATQQTTSWTPNNAAANVNAAIIPKGTGALIADIPDGTAAGGNARGENSVDLQMVRTTNGQVNRGNKSVIAGGENNAIGGDSAPNTSKNNSIGGGFQNTIGGADIAGNSNSNTISGGNMNLIGVRCEYGTIGGGFQNTLANFQIGHTVSGGRGNSATNNYATVVGGQNNNSSNSHAVAGGIGNTASGAYSTAFGQNNVASGNGAFANGNANVASNNRSVCISDASTCSAAYAAIVGGESCTATAQGSFVGGGKANNATGLAAAAFNTRSQAASDSSFVTGRDGRSHLYCQNTKSSGFFNVFGDAQTFEVIARRSAALTTGASTKLSLDGTGVTNLLIVRTGGGVSANTYWNVFVTWLAVVEAIAGTATGVNIGDVIVQTNTLAFKELSNTPSIIGLINTLSSNNDASMATSSVTYTAAGTNELEITFNAPTFVGGGTVTFKVLSKIMITAIEI